MPARTETLTMHRNNSPTRRGVGQRIAMSRNSGLGCKELFVPVQPMTNHIPLDKFLGLGRNGKTQKASCLPVVPGLAATPAAAPRVARPRLGPAGTNEAGELCPRCNLPLGDLGYAVDSEGGKLVHGECKAQLLLQDMQKKDEARLKKDAALKRERRVKYELGWKVARVPRNAGPAAKLGCGSLPQGLCALLWQEESKRITVVPTADPAAAINLEYLSLALKCRKEDGREPMFSLDPKVEEAANKHKLWQVKRFEPAWLDGTSVGEVMFQADYHLKELSMGEHLQPVVGMRSCLDYSEEQGLEREWTAREWFVVNKAEIMIYKDSIVVPRVEMGVEARETCKGEKGLEDVPLTRPDHPMVQYAQEFTHNFELIAERKSVVYHLRELAKASVLAKFLMQNDVVLGEEWFDLADMPAGPSVHREIPQLWNEQRASQIQVQDGVIVSSAEGVRSASVMHGVYGGVEVAPVQVSVGRVPTAKVSVARAPALSQRLIQARTGLAEMPLEVPGAPPGVPKGVDLDLDRFELSKPSAIEPEASVGSWAGEESIGRAFWKNLSGSTFNEEDKDMLKQLFNSQMCDRREDCEVFVPPDTSYRHVVKLRALLEEEATMRQRRKEHFLGVDFDRFAWSVLFPGWRPAVAVAGAQAGVLHPRAELVPEAAKLMRYATASFDKCTEDGIRFRVYEVGSLEVRTIQEPGCEEVAGAVFSSLSEAQTSVEGTWGTIAKTDRVVKAVLYIEHGAEEQGRHFFTLLETDQGDAITVERLEDGSPLWVESPAGLEARKAQAKVFRVAKNSSSAPTVDELRERVSGAEAALLLVAPAKEKAWDALEESELGLARELGVVSSSSWDSREASVFSLAWAELSTTQRSAAEALGFEEVSWLLATPKTVPAPVQPASTWAKPWASLSASQRQAAAALGFEKDIWEAKSSWQSLRRAGSGVWARSWAQLSEAERSAAEALDLGGGDAWDEACWEPRGAWRSRWASLTQEQRAAAERLGVNGAAAWDAAFGGVEKRGKGLAGAWEKSWEQLENDERLAAKTLGICGAGAWDKSHAKGSAEKTVAKLTMAEQEAMMEQWVKKMYGSMA